MLEKMNCGFYSFFTGTKGTAVFEYTNDIFSRELNLIVDFIFVGGWISLD